MQRVQRQEHDPADRGPSQDDVGDHLVTLLTLEVAVELVAEREQNQETDRQEQEVRVARPADGDRSGPDQNVHQEHHVDQGAEQQEQPQRPTGIPLRTGRGPEHDEAGDRQHHGEREIGEEALRVRPVDPHQVRHHQPRSDEREHDEKPPLDRGGRCHGRFHPRGHYRTALLVRHQPIGQSQG